MNRRRFLAGATVCTCGSLAGCSSLGRTGSRMLRGVRNQIRRHRIRDRVEDSSSTDQSERTEPGSDNESVSEVTIYDIDRTVSLETLEYHRWVVQPGESNLVTDEVLLEYRLFVRDGPPVDVLFIEPEEYPQFSAGDRFMYFTEISELNTRRTDRSVTIDPFEFFFIVSNESTETSIVEVELEIQACISEC